MNSIEIVEALCRIAQEAISLIADESKRDAMIEELNKALGEN